MSNYHATARSNYFAVKDETTFRQWAEFAGLAVLDPPHLDPATDGTPRFAITPVDGDDDGWPLHRYDEATGEHDDLDIPAELATHLKDGEVAVLIEVGSEKLRYLSGYATAVNSKGETVNVSLNEIYRLALKLGPNITRAEY